VTQLVPSGLVLSRREGTISWHEFLAATMDASVIDDEHISLAFKRIDTTGCGYITK
jgi:Ca2+-binding EF-hand superfamily protein